MVKKHNVKITIKNESNFEMDFYGDWFDSGRLADTFEWPKVIKDGDEAEILCYEKDWALAGCSGYVQYKMVDSVLTIAFSNPSAGKNKVNVGTDGKAVWTTMSDHGYEAFTVDVIINDVTMTCHCKCSGSSTNVAEVSIKKFVPGDEIKETVEGETDNPEKTPGEEKKTESEVKTKTESEETKQGETDEKSPEGEKGPETEEKTKTEKEETKQTE